MRDLRRRFPEELRNWQKSLLWSDRRSPEMAGIPEETMAQSPEMAEMLEKITAQSPEMAEMLEKITAQSLEMVEIPEKTMVQDQEVELVHPVQTLPNRRSVKESRISAVTVKRDILIL